MFNAEIAIQEQLNRQLTSVCTNVVENCVKVLALKYNFDEKEALEYLNLSSMKTVTKKVEKQEKKKQEKPAFPLPFCGMREGLCQSIKYNGGLFTQCQTETIDKFCKSCGEKNGGECGTVEDRMSVGLYEFCDKKNRKPTLYTKIMKKHKLTREQVEEEASKFNLIVDEEHFQEAEPTKRGRPSSNNKEEKKPKGAKGRPRKSEKVINVEGETEEKDVIAQLVLDENQNKKQFEVEVEKEVEKEEEKVVEKEVEKEEKKSSKKSSKKSEKEPKKASKKKAEEVVEILERTKNGNIICNFKGEKYVIDEENVVFDFNSVTDKNSNVNIEVGMYDQEKNQIKFHETPIVHKFDDEDEESEKEDSVFGSDDEEE